MNPGSPGAGAYRRNLAQRAFLVAICLLCAAIVFDLFDLATRTGALGLPAYWMTAAGLVLGALGLALALRDVPLPISRHRMRGGAVSGLLVRSLVLALFGASWVMRRPEADIPLASLALSVLGAALAVATFWRGGEPPEEPQPQSESESSPASSRMRVGEVSLPPETGRTRVH